jgi:MFS family permease
LRWRGADAGGPVRVLVRSIDKRDFVQVMSTVATFGLLGSVLGPLLGGVLVQYTSWRLIFLLNVPVSIVGLWLNHREMPEYRLDTANRFDLFGFLLFAAASALLLAASEFAADENIRWVRWARSYVLAILFGICLCVAQPSHRSSRGRSELLRIRSVWVSLSGNLLTRLGVSGMFLLIVLFLQVGCGWSPLMAGLMMVPQALGSISAKWLVNRMLIRLGYRRLLFANTLIVACSIAMFALLGPHTPMVIDCVAGRTSTAVSWACSTRS